MSEQQTVEQIAEQLLIDLHPLCVCGACDGCGKAKSLILSALSSVRRQEEEKDHRSPGTPGPADSGRPAPVAAWLPIETLDPERVDVILRPHYVWGAMDVCRVTDHNREMLSLAPEMCWINGDHTTAWPERAFLPFWMERPPAPGVECVSQGDTHD